METEKGKLEDGMRLAITQDSTWGDLAIVEAYMIDVTERDDDPLFRMVGTTAGGDVIKHQIGFGPVFVPRSREDLAGVAKSRIEDFIAAWNQGDIQ